MKRMGGFLVLIGTLVAAPAAAHERGGNALGLVQDVSPARLVIETPDGHQVAFAITKDTRFTRGGATVRLEDVKLGERAAVHGKRDGERLSALQVKLAAPRAGARAPRGR